jgi:membrane protein DedA with SNARE-associated domain
MQWIDHELPGLLSAYGYGAVAALLALESVGFPIPGATVLIAAAVYAGATDRLDIALVIAAAVAGAVTGDNAAYWLGRRTASDLLRRYGPYVGLTDRKLRLGAALFRRHGGKVVFAARFIAFLRVVTMYGAGISRMDWRTFALFNLAGSAAWALVFGAGAYHLGQQAHRLSGPVSVALLIAGAAGLAVAALVVRRHIGPPPAEAEAAFAGRPEAEGGAPAPSGGVRAAGPSDRSREQDRRGA